MSYKYGNELLSKYYDFEEIDTERTEDGISLCYSDYVEGGPTGCGTDRYYRVDVNWCGGDDGPSPGPCGSIASIVCLGIGCVGCYNADTICPAITKFVCDICC